MFRGFRCLTLASFSVALMLVTFWGAKPSSYFEAEFSHKVYDTPRTPAQTHLLSTPDTKSTVAPGSQLGNLTNFRYTINSDKCANKPVFALILIGSHPDHVAIRHIFRDIWGNLGFPQLPFKLIFPFGQPVDQEVQLRLQNESAIYGDIIQGNFVDAYHNVTFRDLMGMRWAWQHCPQATFVVHLDDDISVDVYSLINSLRNDLVNPPRTKGLIACTEIWRNAKVSRTGRYSVDQSILQNDTFDPYCLGWLYVMNPAMAQELDKAALNVRPFWMNDAYITGTLVRVTSHQHQRMKLSYAWDAATMGQMIATWNVSDGKPPRYMFGPHNLDTNLMLSLHQKFRESASLRGLVPSNKVATS